MGIIDPNVFPRELRDTDLHFTFNSRFREAEGKKLVESYNVAVQTIAAGSQVDQTVATCSTCAARPRRRARRWRSSGVVAVAEGNQGEGSGGRPRPRPLLRPPRLPIRRRDRGNVADAAQAAQQSGMFRGRRLSPARLPANEALHRQAREGDQGEQVSAPESLALGRNNPDGKNPNPDRRLPGARAFAKSRPRGTHGSKARGDQTGRSRHHRSGNFRTRYRGHGRVREWQRNAATGEARHRLDHARGGAVHDLSFQLAARKAGGSPTLLKVAAMSGCRSEGSPAGDHPACEARRDGHICPTWLHNHSSRILRHPNDQVPGPVLSLPGPASDAPGSAESLPRLQPRQRLLTAE